MNGERPPTAAAWLGYAGLIPFIALPAATWIGGDYVLFFGQVLFAYGAVILTFVGALHWAFAMTLTELSEKRRNRAFIWSTVAALAAWVALLIAPPLSGMLLVLALMTQYACDRSLALAGHLPAWYLPLRFRLTVVACLGLAAGSIAPGLAVADVTVAPGGYRQGTASAEGIGKFYYGREIAQVMGFEGTPWLERPAREQEERTDMLVRELHLVPGVAVADVGAGSGYLSRRMAPLVTPGKVYAVDVQPQMVDLLTQLSKQPALANIVPVLGAPDDIELPAESIDLAVMVDVYHELAFPQEVMLSVMRALKPGGHVVFVEYRGEDPTVPIKKLHKMTKAQIMLEMQGFPLSLERTSELLPLQHIVVFAKNDDHQLSLPRSPLKGPTNSGVIHPP